MAFLQVFSLVYGSPGLAVHLADQVVHLVGRLAFPVFLVGPAAGDFAVVVDLFVRPDRLDASDFDWVAEAAGHADSIVDPVVHVAVVEHVAD